MDRRAFLAETFGATVLARLPAELLAQTASATPTSSWDSGRVRHLLPGVSANRMLIKASFTQALTAPPALKIGSRTVQGRVNDTRREFWQFDSDGLEPGRQYTLSLSSAGKTLC